MPSLDDVLNTLRTDQGELRHRGVKHAAVCGSLVRGDAHPDSDIDVLLDLDPAHPMGLFDYAGLRLYVDDLLGNRADVANRRALKPLLRETIRREAVDAF